MRRQKINIPFAMAMALLCLTLISFHFTSGLYARYSSDYTTRDTARVAAFRVETELDYVSMGLSETDAVDLKLGGKEEVTAVSIPFYVESGSEVSVAYSVTVDFGAALPDYVTLTLSDGETAKTVTADGTATEFTFTDFGAMDPAPDSALRDELTLSIAVSDLEEITQEVRLPAASLTVTVYQTNE